MTPRIAALVPMRHSSERVPGKNYRPLAGKPLFHHILHTLSACPAVAEIVIDTDSPTIKADVEGHFPHVRLLNRPARLCDGQVPMTEVLLHDVALVPADLYLQTHSTNPLLRPDTVSRAIDRLLAGTSFFDSLFGVTALRERLWDSLARPLNHNPALLLRTQDLPPVFAENSCLYLFTREVLERTRRRIGERPLLFEIDAREAWDIDDELDFEVAEFLLARSAAPREGRQ